MTTTVNPYQLIEDLSKALREKQDDLDIAIDIAEAENSDRADELFDTTVEIDRLNCWLDAYDALIADLRRESKDHARTVQQDGEEIQRLHEEVNALRGANESLRQGLIAANKNVMRLNELLG